ncbi:Cut8 six-helix bundle-domain-containing protein [Schizothecium vesticola]|uniref:Tethering factor for nuclear proteasome STS1 n=1 Tax=Schizothecium vesticola TaxID=314040 RepID=A0AA40KDA5_9PEZI|nr:Cut8 six-helix bundle-domain-containing protein [Schizothecium vesticola]
MIVPQQPETPRFSAPRSMSPYSMASKKRKADDENDEMSVSPTSSPAISSRQLSRPSKKVRAGHELAGRPLPLARLLETLDTAQLRMVLQTICDRRPDIGQEVVNGAPRPTHAASLQVLDEYMEKLRASFPFGNSSSDYTYHRVKQALAAVIDAISDFTPQYLPPVEQQTNISLQYLDGATAIIHSLPDFENQQHRYHKDTAYDDISKAWALVITEGAKRGGGIVMHTNGWDVNLRKHNEQSGGRLGQAMAAMANEVGWMGHNSNGRLSGSSDPNSILNQLVSGKYGSPVPVGRC